MVRVALGIGSNLNRRRHIQAAVSALRDRFGDVTLSPVYRSTAAGFDGPDFYNLAALIDTDLDVDELHDVLREIENGEGRRRSGSRFSSRTLDIDILLYGDAVLYDSGHDIPRREILRHAFVLKPLCDLLPHETHPGLGEPFVVLWRRFAASHPADGLSPCEWKPQVRG